MDSTTLPQISANQFPELYEILGIDPNNLGCIMLSLEPIKASGFILYDDLYQTDPVEHPHMQGVISDGPDFHCTLLYGLLRPGPELKRHVDLALDGWTPQDVTIAGFDVFQVNKPDEQYIALVAKLEVTDNLLEAHARLSLLPHLDTHAEYQPHCTIAYLNTSSNYQGYIRTLNAAYQGKTVRAVGIDYGD